MAGAVKSVLIQPIDQENNLFRITSVFPQRIVDLVMQEDWLNLSWCLQEGQEKWSRRRVNHSAIAWVDQWHAHMRDIWPELERQLGIPIQPYTDTAFWIDEPGFTCPLHTDGEMPGALHLTWFGAGTAFYWYKNPESLRFQVPALPNAGYIMINMPDVHKYRRLLWHGMLEPVPINTVRLSSYTWIIPKT